jgi:hypothetical protein
MNPLSSNINIGQVDLDLYGTCSIQIKTKNTVVTQTDTEIRNLVFQFVAGGHKEMSSILAD